MQKQQNHMNMIQEVLPRMRGSSSQSQQHQSCVVATSPPRPQYGAVQPPLTLEEAETSRVQQKLMQRNNEVTEMLFDGYLAQNQHDLERKLQQSAPNTINASKGHPTKIMMNTNDLFDNVLNLEEEEERAAEDRFMNLVHRGAQHQKKGAQTAAGKPLIKTILKKKTAQKNRDGFTSQCLAQDNRDTSMAQEQRKTPVRLPSQDSYTSEFNPFQSPASGSGGH